MKFKPNFHVIPFFLFENGGTKHAAGTYENDAFLKGVVSLSISAHTPFIAVELELELKVV